VANKDISKIESPETFAREQWIYDLAAAHWSDADARDGGEGPAALGGHRHELKRSH
jgi:hypothetical protein